MRHAVALIVAVCLAVADLLWPGAIPFEGWLA